LGLPSVCLPAEEAVATFCFAAYLEAQRGNIEKTQRRSVEHRRIADLSSSSISLIGSTLLPSAVRISPSSSAPSIWVDASGLSVKTVRRTRVVNRAHNSP